MDGSMFKGLANMLIVGMIAIAIVIGYGGYLGIRALFGKKHKKELVSKEILVPEIRFRTDGKKIDTLYVYKLQKSH